jgi:hypothetical protein
MLTNKPRPIRGISILTALTILVALWIAIPRIACAELHATARGLRSDLTALSCRTDSETSQALRELQPSVSREGAAILGREIDLAARANKLDPLLLVAIGYRESSWLRSVTLGHRRGSLGEVGAFQVHGYGLRFAPRVNGKRCSQGEPACSIRTGARFLAHIRDEICQGSQWRWVAGYGRRSCPSEAQARRDKATLRARRIYCRIRSDCQARWPQ